MQVNCLDEKGQFKSCPYRVITEEFKAVMVGQGDMTTQQFYPCMGEKCVGYYNGICLRAAAVLKENSHG